MIVHKSFFGKVGRRAGEQEGRKAGEQGHNIVLGREASGLLGSVDGYVWADRTALAADLSGLHFEQ